ncbi:alanine racemase [Novosphingobium sp. FKTRR1]|uniref:alanine racemase n=1 Tax=Novosphingobium sp. FKTRR1 TaxID=2879118 RepID=UPI001CEFEAD7
MVRLSRRAAIAGGVVALGAGVGAGTVAALRSADHGGTHDAYFRNVQGALAQAGLAQPVLVVDAARLDANIARLRTAVGAAHLPLRVVVKSLPCPTLLDRVAKGLSTNRFMVFNAPMLAAMLALHPDGDYLTGKPLPAPLVAHLYATLGAPALANVQWLVDTPERIAAYAAIARANGSRMKLSCEIDVGLHRGGFADAAALAEGLKAAQAAGCFDVAGLMGYDAHVAKLGDGDAAWADAQSRYAAAIKALAALVPGDPQRLTLNSAGSYTVMRHTRGTVANEVSVGSAFVKPNDFDIAENKDLAPALFIATPVIKAGRPLDLPGHAYLNGPLAFMDPNTAQAIYIFGGHWLADPVSPPGLQTSDLIGLSSNQQLLTGSWRVHLKPDDSVFLRPHQSEALMLQFGDVVLYQDGRIGDRWPVFPASA